MELTLRDTIHQTKDLPLLSHSGPGAFDNYQTMNLPFDPVLELHQRWVEQEKIKLIHRGEAHITVITPIEFWNVLKPQGVTIQEIQKISQDQHLQNSKFQIICLGSGQASLNGKLEKTFYLVVESEDLLRLRQKVQDLFLSKGGSKNKFQPNNYYPHITLGFTQRDLHESDGVIKDKNSCVASIVEVKK